MEYKIVCGGSWYYLSDACEVGGRYSCSPNGCNCGSGFRVARTLKNVEVNILNIGNKNKVICGGSWYIANFRCKVGTRDRNHPNNRDSFSGFRVTRTLM